MGKRRRPTRKPNYQALEDIKVDNMRMAGDELSLLMEAVPERELSPAYERLLDVAQQFESVNQGLIDAGVPADKLQGLQQLQVRALENGVPAPYIDRKSKRGIERRVHTGVFENALGQRDIMGYPNPETGEVLVTEFGDGRTGRIDGLEIPTNPREVGPRASEILGKHAMWLSGDHGTRMINSTDFSVPDMRTGDGRGIDTHTLRTGRHDGVVEIQVSTGLNPTITPTGDSTQAVRQMIEDKLDDGLSVVEAIDVLKAQPRGGLSPISYRGRDVSGGKLVKEGYDGLISPVLERQAALNNVRGLAPNMQDKQVIAPEAIYTVDLAGVRDALSDLSAAEQKAMMTVSTNRGNNQQGMPRSRVNLDVPVTTPGITDISNEGYVAQLLRKLAYA